MLNLTIWIILLFSGVEVSAAVSQSELPKLRADGEAALSQGDYITASYYFERIRESREWDTFDGRMDVLTRLALIEENRNRFEKASEYYSLVVNELSYPPNKTNLPLQRYYEMRFAECLEHAGFYSRAEEVYWNILKDGDVGQRVSILQRMLRNYQFQTISQQKLETLHTLIMKEYPDILGWNLADLYRNQGKYEKSYDLFENLWSTYPVPAQDYLPALVEVYGALKRTDELLRKIQSLENDPSRKIPFLSLEIGLLEQVNRGKEALSRLEQVIPNLQETNNPTGIEQTITQIPKELLFKWLDLVAQHRSMEAALEQSRKFADLLPMDTEWQERFNGLLIGSGKKAEAIQAWEDWARKNAGNPLMVLNAVERIAGLGSTEHAARLLAEMKNHVPPPLAAREAETCLKLGQYERALAAYEIAVNSKAATTLDVTSSIHQYIRSATDVQPLVAALMRSATGHGFQTLSFWMRDLLLDLAVQTGRQSELETLAAGDKTGVWALHIARTAVKYGDREWARKLLESVPKASLYRSTAEQDLAELYGKNNSVPAQRRAAELLRPALSFILDSTNPVQLNDTLVEKILQYGKYNLNAFQPAEALVAIRQIENSSSTLKHSLPQAEADQLLFSRARALAQLASFQPALAGLDRILLPSLSTDARFLKAQILLAQNQVEEAHSLLDQLATEDESWQRANDALDILITLDSLVGDSLELYCRSWLYRLQGRVNDAAAVLRQLAVDQFGNDMEEWARYTIGELKDDLGDQTGALDEWNRLLIDVDRPVLQGKIRMHLLHLNHPAGEPITDTTDFQKLLMDFPDSLVSDLVRLEAQQNLIRKQP